MPGRSAINENVGEASAAPTSKPGSNRPAQNDVGDRAVFKTKSAAATEPVEPEDAYLTGVSRSLQRRLLGLNVDSKRTPGSRVPRPAESKK